MLRSVNKGFNRSLRLGLFVFMCSISVTLSGCANTELSNSSFISGKDAEKCVNIESGSVSGDAVRTDFGLLLTRNDKVILDDSGSESVLTGGVEKVFAVEYINNNVMIVYGEVGEESNLVVLSFNSSGIVSKTVIGAYKAPEFIVTGVSFKADYGWVVTSISDLSEYIEIIPLDSGESTVVEPYEYNSEPFLHMAFPRYTGDELLVIEEFSAKTDFNPSATGWSVARIDMNGLTLERIEWPSDLGKPSGGFDYRVNGEFLEIYVETSDGKGAVIVDDGDLSFKPVCSVLKGRWYDRRR